MQQPPPPLADATSCGSLLLELQELWGEIGESDAERDRLILQLEQECLNVYRRKVEQARKHKADLHQALKMAQADVPNLISALGECESFSLLKRNEGTLMEQLAKIEPLLEDLRRKRDERINEFMHVQLQIVCLSAEFAGSTDLGNGVTPQVDERDISLTRLGVLKSQLNELQKEKNLRLQQLDVHMKSIHDMCKMMSLDFKKILAEVNPSFLDSGRSNARSISDSTLERLVVKIQALNQEKKQRLRKLQDLGSTLIELWNLMDTPIGEQGSFDHITSLISASPSAVMPEGCLALAVIEKVELEVKRLNFLKASKLKELALKKQTEIEEIYRSVHMDIDGDAERRMLIGLIDSGETDLSDVLTGIDVRVAKAREQALSRKDILERVEKWSLASEEEVWLDKYERDQNRHSAGRGAHKNLKRAEKARLLVSKLPSLLENLTAKVKAWEMDKGIPFIYDKVRLLESLEEYAALRQQKEEEKRRSRELKRLQEHFAAGQEAMYGAKPSPMRQVISRKPLGQSSNANIVGGTPTSRGAFTPLSRKGCLSSGKAKKEIGKASAPIPTNYVALPKNNADILSP